MSFRSFEITVGKKGVSPSVIHNAGVRSEHNATELKFVLDSDAQSSLNGEQGNGKTLYYRFDAYDGTGNKCSTEPKQVTSLSQSFLFTLENWLTKNGINIKVCLVLTAVKNNETAVEVFSGEVELQLKNISEGEDISGENEESISSLCIATKEAAMRAEKAEQSAAASEEACNEAKEKTLEARLALEEGAVWIFDGGTAVVKVDEQHTIDGAMSDTSTNAVQNKVAKKYVDDEITKVKSDANDKFKEFNIPKIDCGIISCLVSGDSDDPGITTVYFEKEFTAAPTVNITVNSGMGGNGKELRLGVIGVTKTQFSISIVGASDGNIGVHWIAIEK